LKRKPTKQINEINIVESGRLHALALIRVTLTLAWLMSEYLNVHPVTTTQIHLTWPCLVYFHGTCDSN